MPPEPLRFLHAAAPRLDEPLRAPRLAQRQDLGELLRDATLNAFDGVIEAAIEHEVEFLLLTGSLFAEPATIRAHRRFLSGVNMLGEFGIPVFAAVGGGRADARVTKNAANLTAIVREDPDAVAVVSDGRIRALISANPLVDSSGDPDQFAAEGSANPFSLLISTEEMPVMSDWQGPAPRYIASSGRRRRSAATQHGWYHDPGPLQAVSAREHGPHGCSLVAVDAERHVTVELIPTAPVRWHTARIGIDRILDRDDLVERMQSVLLEIESHACERLLIVCWEFIGQGPLFDACGDGAFWSDIVDAIEQSAPAPRHLRRQHQRLRRHRTDVAGDELAAEFVSLLEQLADQQAIGELSLGIGAFDETDAAMIELLRDDCDHHQAVAMARRMGLEWLESATQS